MARRKGFFEMMGRWERLASRLAPLIEERPYLAELHAELERLIGQGKSLEAESKALLSRRMELTQAKEALARVCETLSGRLAAALRFEHGFTSAKLVEFGLKPLASRPRRQEEVPPAPTPTE